MKKNFGNLWQTYNSNEKLSKHDFKKDCVVRVFKTYQENNAVLEKYSNEFYNKLKKCDNIASK